MNNRISRQRRVKHRLVLAPTESACSHSDSTLTANSASQAGMDAIGDPLCVAVSRSIDRAPRLAGAFDFPRRAVVGSTLGSHYSSAMARLPLILLAVAALTIYFARAEGETAAADKCLELGFNSDVLLCSSCEHVDEFVDNEQLLAECAFCHLRSRHRTKC